MGMVPGTQEQQEQAAAKRKHVLMHVVAICGFVGGILTLSILVNGVNGGIEAEQAVKSVTESTERRPAMLRLPFTRAAQRVLKTLSAAAEWSKMEWQGPVKPGVERFGLGSSASDFSHGLNIATVAHIEPVGFNYAAILPSSLSPTADGTGVATQILDHSVSSLMHQDTFRNSFVGKAAVAVEETMRADVNFGGSEPESIKHNLKFQMKATDAKAKVEYSGVTNAEVSYSVAHRQVDVEVFEPLSTDSKLVFSHSAKPSESLDMVSLRLSW